MKPSELDALVSEEVMGISLHRPSRAMIEVGRGHVTCTGSEFALTTGDQLLMPKGNDLPDPEDSRDWNDRYFHYVGEWLSRKYPYIAQEIKDWRMRPKHYSTDIVVGLGGSRALSNPVAEARSSRDAVSGSSWIALGTAGGLTLCGRTTTAISASTRPARGHFPWRSARRR
jgi:hypothetical protein